jgi:hypothetical protein
MPRRSHLLDDSAMSYWPDAHLDAHDPSDTSDENYVRLQLAMEAAAPELAQLAWAHKYWFLLYSDRLDEFHSYTHQWFYSLKLLQTLPVIPSSVKSKAPRFVLAGRFVAAARELEVPVPILNQMMFIKYGPPRRYWKIGTTDLPPAWLYQLSIYSLASPSRTSVILYASMDDSARDEKIEIRPPLHDVVGTHASVVVRPVPLAMLADLVSQDERAQNLAKRRQFAESLIKPFSLSGDWNGLSIIQAAGALSTDGSPYLIH